MTDTGRSPAGLSGLTLLSLALTGLGALAAPDLQRRFGLRQAVLWGLAALAVGSGLHVLPVGTVALPQWRRY